MKSEQKNAEPKIHIRIATQESQVVLDAVDFVKVLQDYILRAPKKDYMLYQAQEFRVSLGSKGADANSAKDNDSALALGHETNESVVL